MNDRAAREADALSLTFLRVLEELGPAARVVFLLHDVFRRDLTEVGRLVGESEPGCERLLLCARRKLKETKASIETSRRRRDNAAARDH